MTEGYGNSGVTLRPAALRFLASLAAGVGGLILLGWTAGQPELRGLFPGASPTHPVSATGLLLLGTAVGVASLGRRFWARAALPATVSMLLGAAALISLVYGMERTNGPWFSVGQLENGQLPALTNVPSGAALCLFLLGGAFLLQGSPRLRPLTSTMIHAALLIAMLRVFTAAFDIASIHGFKMSLGASIGFIPLCFAIVSESRSGGPVGLLLGPGQGSRLARFLLPAGILIPFGVALLRIQAERTGLFDSHEAAAIAAGTNAVAFMLIILWASWLLNRADAQRLQREEVLKQSETHLRSMYEAPLIAIASWGAESRVLRANQTFLDTLGYTREQLDRGELSWDRLSPPEDDELRKEKWIEMNEYHRVEPFEREFICGDGSRVPVLFGSVLLQEEPQEGVAFILNITELKQTRDELLRRNNELELANAELDSFSYSVSHDLRAPLRGIEGFSRALEEDYSDKLDDEARHYIERIRAGTMRMAQLIDDLLQLSRVSRADLNATEVDLTALAESVAAQLKEADPKRSVEWSIEPGMTAWADNRLLRIVLENLFGNAWKFTARREPARIEFGSTLTHEGEPAFYVRDNGAGFDMRYAGKLFTAFQRLHRAEDYPGTGIGLATVRRIILRHQGTVSADSKPEEGTTFTFTLGVRP